VRGILLHYFIQKNLQLKHTKFLLRLTATILYGKPNIEIGLDVRKIMILMSKIKNALAHRKTLRTKNSSEVLLHEDLCQTLAELADSLGVDHNSFETCESIRNKEKSGDIGCPTSWSRETSNGVFFVWTAASMAEKETFFASWLVIKNGYTTITLSIENHEVSVAMHQHHWQNRSRPLRGSKILHSFN